MRKYDAIYQDLKDKIEAEIYATGSLLPSESALQDMYQASRDTVRKALRLLKDERLSTGRNTCFRFPAWSVMPN